MNTAEAYLLVIEHGTSTLYDGVQFRALKAATNIVVTPNRVKDYEFHEKSNENLEQYLAKLCDDVRTFVTAAKVTRDVDKRIAKA